MGNTSSTPSRPKSLGEFLERYKGKLVAPHHQRGLGEGICHGMCLDWVRSMLHGDVSGFKKYATLDMEGFKAVVLVQGEIHKLFAGSIVDYQRQVEQDVVAQRQRMREIKQRQTRISDRYLAERASVNRMIDVANVGPLMAHLDPVSRGNFDQAIREARGITLRRGAVYVSEMKRLRWDYDMQEIGLDLKLLILKMNADDFLQTYPHLYQFFKVKYKERFESRDSFDDIQLGESTPSGSPDDLLKWTANIRTCIQKLGAGQAALLNFRRSGGGHFVGFFHDGGRYHFFDPNAGWYCVASAEDAGQLFEDLFYAVYASMGYDSSEWRLFLRG